ncbi:MAG: twin-arginine translocase subunit TatC [Actinomycetota bacterium]
MVALVGRRSSKPARDPEGRMTLGEHLRELRSRLVKSILAVILLGVIGVVFYEEILAVLMEPFLHAREIQGLDATINYETVVSPFTVPLKIGLITGFVLASPVWIYQLWAFVTPALYRNERKWAAAVVAVSVPLFLGGIVLCYMVLPRGLEVLLGFTPENVSNIVNFNVYFNFVIRLIIFFGIGFMLPVFVVLLNAVGVLSQQTLANARRWIILGVFIFAALANPSGEPITMLTLAIPMYLLFEIAILVCRFNDRRRERAMRSDVGDDEASPLEEVPRDPADDRPSTLDDDDST